MIENEWIPVAILPKEDMKVEVIYKSDPNRIISNSIFYDHSTKKFRTTKRWRNVTHKILKYKIQGDDNRSVIQE